jgi:hypothetical protein
MLFKRGFTLTGEIVNLSDLQNLHKGETVWVLGSGPSLNYIDGSLFDDKTTVTTNFSARALGVRQTTPSPITTLTRQTYSMTP